MKKKIALLLNLILLGCCLTGVFCWRFFTPALGYRSVDAEDIKAMKATHTQAAEPFFTALAFSGEQLPYDSATSTFYLPLDMETDVWESGELSSLDKSVQLLFEEDMADTDKQEAIRTGKAFCFYAVKDGEYQVCQVVATGLPVISIETAESADTEVFGGSAFFWDNTTKINWTSSSILEAHIRGNTSRMYPKKGYKLTLKKQKKSGDIVADKKSLFGLRSDDEWILNAMYTDSSKIRDKLNADLWSEIGAVRSDFPSAYFGTRMTYVEVFFNHEYWGLYMLAEPVDSKQLNRAKLNEGKAEEYSYKSVTPQTLPTDELLNQPEYGQNLDGYELKGKRDTVERSDWEPLLDYLKLRDLTTDEEFRETASALTDREGALNVWIFLQAVLGIDNRGKNMYYVAKQTASGPKLYFAPWDMDITWGDALSENEEGDSVWKVGLFTGLYSERINWAYGDRLVELDVDETRDYVNRTWKELRADVFSEENLMERIDGLVHQVQDSGAYTRNEERWPDSSSGQNYDLFKRMAFYRFGILDYYFNGNLEEYMGLGYE